MWSRPWPASVGSVVTQHIILPPVFSSAESAVVTAGMIVVSGILLVAYNDGRVLSRFSICDLGRLGWRNYVMSNGQTLIGMGQQKVLHPTVQKVPPCRT